MPGFILKHDTRHVLESTSSPSNKWPAVMGSFCFKHNDITAICKGAVRFAAFIA